MSSELAAEAARVVSLIDVALADHAVRLGPAFNPISEAPSTAMNTQYGPTRGQTRIAETVDGEKHFMWTVIFTTHTRIFVGEAIPEAFERPDQSGELSTADQQRLLADIRADFRVELVAKLEHQPSAQAQRAFATMNIKHLVWPHVREFIQSTCARTRLPMATLDLLRPQSATAAPLANPASEN